MDSIPSTLRDIDEDWLSQALSMQAPGTRVREVEIVDAHSGTTGRGRLNVAYVDDRGLPQTLFVKLAPDDDKQRLFVASNGMGRREAMFYQGLYAEVPVRVPRCYFSSADDSGEQYIMLLEDLEASGCSFRNSSERCSMDYARSMLSQFALLHARFWESPRLQQDLAWVEPPLQHEIGAHLVAAALEQFARDMPPVFREMGELYAAEADAIHQLWNRGAPTLVHGDVHDANLFIDKDVPGFMDWALICRTTGMRDVSFFLAGTLDTEDRRVHERALLVFYRECLLAAGVQAPPMDDLWRQYQWHAAYRWVGATSTLAMRDAWQPVEYTRKSLDRINAALTDLGSVASISDALSG
ncbi:MAG: hypothetical protein CL933_03460 [Deltaproteobacteria bacterium]|nr:hypothetical protein [Deltaproteobacteria bacterium]